MRILFIPGDIDSIGCHRAIFPMRELGRHGHETTMPDHEIIRGLDKNGNEATHLVFYFTRPDGSHPFDDIRRMMPDVAVFSGATDKDGMLRTYMIPYLKSIGCTVVADLDDWYGHKKVRQTSKKEAALTGREYVDYGPMFEIVKAADAFTTTTEHLAAEYKKWNPNTFVLRNYIDWTLYQEAIPNSMKRRPRGRVRVGWMGGIRWGRKDDLLEIAGILGPLLDRHPNVDVCIAGSERATDYAFRLLGVPEGRRIELPTIGYHHRRLPDMLDFDIGLIPLRESRFNHGKSWLKALEYAAMGIPFVAAGWHPGYQEIVRRAPCGFLASTAADWGHYLDLLISQESNRRTMGKAGRRLAEKLTIERHWWRWQQVYEEVNAWRRKPRLTSDLLMRAAMGRKIVRT